MAWQFTPSLYNATDSGRRGKALEFTPDRSRHPWTVGHLNPRHLVVTSLNVKLNEDDLCTEER